MFEDERLEKIVGEACESMPPMPDGWVGNDPTMSLIRSAIRQALELAAQASERVTPRHTECGNKIAAAIRALAKEKNDE